MNQTPPAPTGASRLRHALRSGHFALTAEITPPLASDPDLVLRKALPLAGLADAVNVTDGAGARTRMSAVAAAAILARGGVEPVLQLTCRDRNRIALQSDSLGAIALGIRNFLVLRGDDPSAGDQPETKPVFDLDSRALLATLKGIRDDGELPTKHPVEGPHDILIGAADTPVDPPPDWSPKTLVAKADAGAQFIQTQFCMDAGIVARYIARLADLGLLERLSVLIGVAPLVSAGSARWIVRHLPGAIIPDAIVARMEGAKDPKAEGRRICVELIQQLATIRGVAGAHIMAPLHEEAIPAVIQDSGLLLQRR